MDASRVASARVILKRFVQVKHRDDLRQDVLQHTEEELRDIIIILSDAGLPVATRSGEGTGAVPRVRSDVPDEVGSIRHLLEHGESRSLNQPLEFRDLMISHVRYPVEAVGGVGPVQVGSEASNPSIS